MKRNRIVAKVLAKLSSVTWYHGRSVKSDEFNLKFTGKGHDEDGPGFYFTKNKEAASQYAHPSGLILAVELDSPNLLKGDATYEEVEKLIKDAPRYEDTLEDYAMPLPKVIKQILKQESRKEVFEQIWYDFYHNRNATPAYLKNLVEMGWDGHKGTKMQDVLVIYNPDIINVLDKEEYKE